MPGPQCVDVLLLCETLLRWVGGGGGVRANGVLVVVPGGVLGCRYGKHAYVMMKIHKSGNPFMCPKTHTCYAPRV